MHLIAAVLVVLSAMKTKMVIESPLDGTVKSVHVVDGQTVAAGDLVIEIDA